MMLFVALPLLACFQFTIDCTSCLSAVQWTSTYQNTTKVCTGHNLSFGWDFRLEPGETAEDIKWLFAFGSGQTPSILASLVYGYFNPAPSYGNRLTHLSNGTIVLSGMTTADAGTYIMEVITRQTTGSFSSIRRNLVVDVTDPSTYSSNTLYVEMDSQAVLDAHGKFHIQLTCGPLAWRGEPPVDVIWTSPSGAKLNSTGYKNSTFYLLLENPIASGVYTCGLPANAIPTLCLQSGDPLTQQATFAVDAVNARLVLLEAKEEALTKQLQQVKTEQDQFRAKSSANVGFHAAFGNDLALIAGETIRFSHIVYNHGGAYNSGTGQFTAPLDGTYFFAFTSSPYGFDQVSDCYLVVGSADNGVAWSHTKTSGWYNPNTGHAVAHLVKGTRVWVRNYGSNNQVNSQSLFSGFLIRPDW